MTKRAPYNGLVQFRVDYDTRQDVMKKFGARDRSTLIAFRGNREVGRLSWETGEKEIRALVDRALANRAP
jgi:hypothetical protein